MHKQIYSHENTCWRMACVGYRAWAWKRLLVKAVFFDALTKITTRSSLQLSFFEPFSRLFPADGTAPDFHNKEIREMISDTKDTFGEMAFKAKHIENNLIPKRVQLIFTVFKKKRRVAKMDGRHFEFDKKTITQARQARQKRMGEIRCSRAACALPRRGTRLAPVWFLRHRPPASHASPSGE